MPLTDVLAAAMLAAVVLSRHKLQDSPYCMCQVCADVAVQSCSFDALKHLVQGKLTLHSKT